MKQPIDSLGRSRPARHVLAAAIAAAFGTVAISAWAQLPAGGTAVHGSAAIATDGGRMTVTNSPNAVLDWQAFSIGARNSVHFAQQSAASQVLNRVVGNDPSAILGSLSSNGGVWLVNPHGVLFGSNARIDVGGLVASTLPVSNEDFLAGRLRFDRGTLPGGQVLNQGEIVTSFGGRVWLMGDSVRNEGLIHSPGGHIVLAAGRSIELVDSGMPNVTVRVTAPDSEAVNLGTLLAPAGGSIDVHGGIVNQRGIVRADSIGTDPAGRVVIRAQGAVQLAAGSATSADAAGTGQGGRVVVESAEGAALVLGGVSATSGAAAGGRIHLLGRQVGIDGNALVDASGALGAGQVLAGGDYQGTNPAVRNAEAAYLGPAATLRANATAGGDGGKVILWGDGATRVFGTIEARGGPAGGNGGLVETSGRFLAAKPASVDTSAPRGTAGTWLLDPGNITIVADDGGCCSPGDGTGGIPNLTVTSDGDDTVILASTIVDALQSGNNVEIRTGGGAGTTQEGNITVAASIQAQGDGARTALRLAAHNDIVVERDVDIGSAGFAMPVTLLADSDNNGAGSILLNPNTEIATQGGDILLLAATRNRAPEGVTLSGSRLDAGSGIVALRGNAVTIGAGSEVAGAAVGMTADAITVSDSSVNAPGVSIALNTRLHGDGRAEVTNSVLSGANVGIVTGSLEVGRSQLSATRGSLDISSTTASGGGTATFDDVTLGAQRGAGSSPGNIGITADRLDMTDADLTATDVTIRGAAASIDNAGSVANIRASRLSIDAGTLRLASVDVVAEAPQDAIVITAGSLASTGSRLATPIGRWLVHLRAGQGGFPAAALGDLDYTFVQFGASDAAPAHTGIGAHGIMLDDALDIGIRVDASRPYDRTTAATFSQALSHDAGPGIAVRRREGSGTAGGTFADRNAGTDKAVLFQGEGGYFDIAAANGSPVYGATQSYVADITRKDITLAGLVAAPKVYDASRAATLSGRLAGIIEGDDVTVGGATGLFSDKNAGTGKPVAMTGGTLAGPDAGNYRLAAGATTTGTITPLSISAAGITAADKVYDGSRDATLSGSLSDVLGGDDVSLAGATGSFDDRHAGVDKPVTILTGSLAGADAGNYVLAGRHTTTATIAPRPITAAGITAVDRVYDGTRVAALSGTLADAIAGDAVTLAGATGRFDDKNAGTGKVVAVTGGALAGADAGNYTLVAGHTTTAAIAPRPIDAAGLAAADKVYDGNRDAELSGALAGAIAGDAVALAGATGRFDSKDAGADKIVTITGGTLSGADAANYVLVSGATARAAITPRPVSIGIAGQVAKEYDATSAAGLGAGQFVLDGAIAGDAVSVTGPAQGTYDSATVGQGKNVSVTGNFQVAGADAGNYRVGTTALGAGGVVTTTASGNTGVITPATLVYTAAPALREPGLPVEGLTGTVSGFRGTDSLASATTGTLAWLGGAGEPARPGLYPITGTGLSAVNYVLVQAPGNATALQVTAGNSPASPPQQAQGDSVAAIAAALRSAIPATDPRQAGGGLLDISNPAVGKTYGAVRIGAMSQEDLVRMIAERRAFKRKLFADAIYKLELDPSLADVQPCTTVIEASTGACRILPNQLDLLGPDTRLAALPGNAPTADNLANGSAGSSAGGTTGSSAADTNATKAPARSATAHVPQIERKIAVLFGINDYADKTIPPLENAVPDVDAVSALFADKLGYEVRVVRNPTRADIIRTLNQLSVETSRSDSVVIYYAGHGYSLERNGAGYWLPADAQASDPGKWISNGDVARLLSSIRSSQMVLISDSCYSGAFARDGMAAVGHDVTPESVLAKRSVVVISSGGDEPVADEGKAGHSIFAWNLMEAMRAVSNWKPGSTVFNDVQAGVKKEFPQTPRYGSVTAAGHQAGGDYLFELR
jgi:filamentous hemagglutinin family protein